VHRVEVVGFLADRIDGSPGGDVIDRRKDFDLDHVTDVMVWMDRPFAGVAGVMEHRAFSAGCVGATDRNKGPTGPESETETARSIPGDGVDSGQG
jgi:hypothetical protein